MASSPWRAPPAGSLFARVRDGEMGAFSTTPSKVASAQIARGLPYYRDWKGHFGCVNALAFSRGESNFLASGGDDCRVLVWHADPTAEHPRPVDEWKRHTANIFSIAWNCDNSRVVSGGLDGRVHLYDPAACASVLCMQMQSNMMSDSVYRVSASPASPHVFMYGSESGHACLFDERQRTGVQKHWAGPMRSVQCVEFCPSNEHLAVMCVGGAASNVALLDTRAMDMPVLEYEVPPRRAGARAFDASNAVWDAAGQRFLTTFMGFVPVLYNREAREAQCCFTARGYSNLFTMKSPAFAGDAGEFVVGGSDDFAVYVWRVPELLAEVESGGFTGVADDHAQPQRAYVPHALEGALADELAAGGLGGHIAGVGCVGEALHALRGHRSIPNQVVAHPHEPFLVSSGVEKVVKWWAPIPLCAADHTRASTPYVPRERGPGRPVGPSPHEEEESVEESLSVLHMFDAPFGLDAAEYDDMDMVANVLAEFGERDTDSSGSSSAGSEELPASVRALLHSDDEGVVEGESDEGGESDE